MTALHAEWTKLRTVRSTPWSLALTALITIGLGAFVCSLNHTEGAGGGGDDDLVALSLAGAYFGQLAAVALGVFAVAGSRPTAQLADRSASDPRRRLAAQPGAAPGSVGAKVALVGGRDCATRGRHRVALLFGPFLVAAMVPEPTWRTLMSIVPTAGLAGQENGAPSSPWAGLAVTGAWAAAALLAGLRLLRRRDV